MAVNLLLLSCVVAAASGDGLWHTLELQAHCNHVAHISSFPCREPQVRVFSVSDMLPKDLTEGKAYFPDVTVLHVCDHRAGCCQPGYYCRPKQFTKVTLPFKITFLQDIGRHKTGSWIMEQHEFYNHTACHCFDSSLCFPADTRNELNDVAAKF